MAGHTDVAWSSHSMCGPQSALGPTSKSGARGLHPGRSGASDVGTGLLVLGRSWSSSFPAVSLASTPESWRGTGEARSSPALLRVRGEVRLLLPSHWPGAGRVTPCPAITNQRWFSRLRQNLAPKGPSSACHAWFRTRSACLAQLCGVHAGALSMCESFPQNCHDQDQSESAPSRQAVGL